MAEMVYQQRPNKRADTDRSQQRPGDDRLLEGNKVVFKGTAQLEAMTESSPQTNKQARLGAMINSSPAMVAQRKVVEDINSSPYVTTQRQKLESLAGGSTRQLKEEPPQGKLETSQRVEATAKPNNTGLPDNLKSGIEALSGISMDNVKVHYNSLQPAQLNALAYAQGSDIHVAPGQEQHLPHEAWHVVQQAQGRVRPTMQMKGGVPVNADKRLEHEADVMGARALKGKEDKSKIEYESESKNISLTMQQKNSSSDIIQKVTGAVNVKLWIPTQVAEEEAIYLIDASHRGDMYHVRAAQAIRPYPILIYNCKSPNDLVNYLTVGGEKIGQPVITINWNPATQSPPEEELLNYIDKTDAGFEVVSESGATSIIAQKDQNVTITSTNMNAVPKELQLEIDDLIPKIFKSKQKNGALLMFRDSGEKSGVYPELDSGEALTQLASMIDQKGFTPILCGNPDKPQYEDFESIGTYWIYLNFKGQDRLKRDIEAYFMQKAYSDGYYKVVIGFRSGVLDSFTFMGIPTISISLNQLVGEDRHNRLVSKGWNRTNILYNFPRHEQTGMVFTKREAEMYMSPFWKIDTKEKSLFEEISPPGPLNELDESVVDKGLDIGLSKINKGQSPFPEFRQGAITSESVRGLIPNELASLGKTEVEEKIILRELLVYLLNERANEIDSLKKLEIDTEEVNNIWEERIGSVIKKRSAAFAMKAKGIASKEDVDFDEKSFRELYENFANNIIKEEEQQELLYQRYAEELGDY